MNGWWLFGIFIALCILNGHLDDINVTLKGAIHGQDTSR